MVANLALAWCSQSISLGLETNQSPKFLQQLTDEDEDDEERLGTNNKQGTQ